MVHYIRHLSHTQDQIKKYKKITIGINYNFYGYFYFKLKIYLIFLSSFSNLEVGV